MKPKDSAAWMTAVGFLTAVLLTIGVPTGFAASENDPMFKGLPAEQAERIQGVGRSLLQAKRTYEPPEEMSRIRKDLEQLHTLLNTFLKPVEGDKVRLEAVTERGEGGQETRDHWREKRKDEIEQLFLTADSIGGQSKVLAERRSLRGKAHEGRDTLFPLAVQPCLERLGHLRSELDQVVSLPAETRQKRLLEIKDQLKLSRRSGIGGKDSRPENPTMRNRNKHRPLGK